MNLSQRARAAEPFYAMEFAKRAAALEAAGHHVVRLNLGEPDFGAPAAVTAELQRLARSGDFAYTPALGIPELRQAIAVFYGSRHGVNVDPARVVVTAGASAALMLVCASLIDPGDEVLLADPSYPCNRQFVEVFGGHPRPIPTDASSRFQLDHSSVQEHWSDATRGVMIATPSNPTGTSVRPAELTQICATARERGGWRIVDEIYLELADHDLRGRAAPTVLAHDTGAIVINSFSKYFGMTGWRLGWCVLPEAMIPSVEALAQNLYICASAPAQHAALACFTPDALAECEARRLQFLERRQVALRGLADIGLPVGAEPDGAFYIYFDISKTGMDSWTFCERAIDEARVALTPGRDFGEASAAAHVRLSYATSEAEIADGLRGLHAWLG